MSNEEKQGLEEIPDPVGASDTSFLDNNSCMRMGGAGDRLGQHLTKRVIGIAPVVGNGIRDAQGIAPGILGIAVGQGLEIGAGTRAGVVGGEPTIAVISEGSGDGLFRQKAELMNQLVLIVILVVQPQLLYPLLLAIHSLLPELRRADRSAQGIVYILPAPSAYT